MPNAPIPASPNPAGSQHEQANVFFCVPTVDLVFLVGWHVEGDDHEDTPPVFRWAGIRQLLTDVDGGVARDMGVAGLQRAGLIGKMLYERLARVLNGLESLHCSWIA